MMTEETKQSLQLAFEVLRRTLIDNNCSVALSKSGISVFDTATYMQTGKFDGITVDVNSLVSDDIGKTVFLTHEEAESKLSEMEGGHE